MSRSTQILKELTTGVHLVILGGFSAVRNPDGTLKESETGEKLIQVRFTDNFNKHFDKQYWVKGKREFEFNKMMTCAGIDRSKPIPLKEMEATATGKRLWVCIREVHEIDGEVNLGISDYQIFDYEPCLNPEKKPVKKGDPASNKGIATGGFIAYKTKSLVEMLEPLGNEILNSEIKIESKLRESMVEKLIPLENEMNLIALKKQQEAIKEKEIAARMDNILGTTQALIEKIQPINNEEKLRESSKISEFQEEKEEDIVDYVIAMREAQMDKIIEPAKDMIRAAAQKIVSDIVTTGKSKVNTQEIIAKAKEMIAKVEGKVKEPKKDTDTINWEDYK